MSTSVVQRVFSRADLPDATLGTRVKRFIGDYGLAVVFAVVFVYFSISAPGFLTVDNISNVVRQSSIVGLVAFGITIVMITSGIDLSVGSVVGLSAVAAAIAGTAGDGSTVLAIGAGVAVGLVVGLVNGAMVTWGGIIPFLATLATLAVARSAALIITNGQPVFGLPDSFQWLGTGLLGPVPVPVVLFLLIAVVTDFVLSRTRFGRHVYAVGGSEESAQKVGIQVRRIKFAVYSISGLLAALAGIVLTARVDGADPLAGTGYELQAIAAAVIGGTSLFGGRGSIRGTVLGVLLLGFVTNGLNLLNVSSYYQQGVQGLVLVLAVLLSRWKSD